MEQRLTLITIGVHDIEAMTNFYEHVFEWKKMDSSNEHITFFKLNGFLFSLYLIDKLAEDAVVSPEGTGFNNFALAYNVSSIKAVDALFQELEQKGVHIIKKPKKSFWGGYSGYITDVENNLWELAYNPYL